MTQAETKTEKLKPPRDRVVEHDDGFYAIVAGVSYGAWNTRALALAGMKVEQHRLAKRRQMDAGHNPGHE